MDGEIIIKMPHHQLYEIHCYAYDDHDHDALSYKMYNINLYICFSTFLLFKKSTNIKIKRNLNVRPQ